MSSRACRALAATILMLVAVAGLTIPVAAQRENLVTISTTEYEFVPSSNRIDVSIIYTLRNRGDSPIRNLVIGPVYVEEDAVPNFSQNASRRQGGSSDVPGPWQAIEVNGPPLQPGERKNVTISYRIRGNGSFPVSLGRGYVYGCVPGQPADRGSIEIDIDTGRFDVTTSGSPVERTASGFRSERVTDPASLFTCIEAANPRQLLDQRFLGPADREVILQSEQRQWLNAAQEPVEKALDDIRQFLGLDIPGNEPVIVREAPPSSLGGFAGDHSSPGVVQVDQSAGRTSDEVHEAAHAWFTTDAFPERWMREGLAEWTSTSLAGQACAPVGPDSASVDLSTWQTIRPTAPEDIESVIAAQDESACGVISAIAARMPDDSFKQVISALLAGESKYIGSDGPGSAPSNIVDFREFLDAVDERGLVPAGEADLDFAQDLLASFGIVDDAPLLEQRSAARARYHGYLERATPIRAPAVIRQSMDNWQFGAANRHLDQMDDILDTLTSADELVPSAGLLTIFQDEIESARSTEDLEIVRGEALTLLENATEVVEPLAELAAAAPFGWQAPQAIQNAIVQRRFDDIIVAIGPSLRIVRDAGAADAALPEANLLDPLRVRYEASPTIDDLEELADEVEAVRRQAQATANELLNLESQVGDWRIPAAVTDPVSNGEISAALTVARDARGVITAVNRAERSLPEAAVAETFKPRFEAVMSAEEMASLRSEAEAARDQAVAVGDALRSLRSTVGEWTLPAIVTEPIDDRDFALAAQTATAAQAWVENAVKAELALEDLEDLEALATVRPQFENATTLAELQAGARVMEDWATAAERVAAAFEVYRAPRDLMTQIGLFGGDPGSQLTAAIDAVKSGDVAQATAQAAFVIDTIRGGSGSGGLRLIGLVFLGVAILGVFGLLVIFRRESGPPWARSTKPPWAQ